jgi:hypothetical protein
MTLGRLRDEDATDTERALLDSARDDLLSTGARARTLAALGIAGAVATSGVARAATELAAGGGGGAVATKGATLTGIAIAKWFGAGVAVGALTMGGVAVLTAPHLAPVAPAPITRSAPPVTPAPITGTAPPRGEGGQEARPVPARASDPTSPVDESPGGMEPATRARGAPPAARPDEVDAPAPPTDRARDLAGGPSLVEEVGSLDRARAALASGDPREALSRLARHEQRFPSGALEPEAVVLRVRALVQLGQQAEAHALAGRFLAAQPNSPQAARLRALISAPAAR